MSHNRARVIIRTKRWCKCIIASRKVFIKKHRFSTQAFEALPVTLYDRIIDGGILQSDEKETKIIIRKEEKEDNESDGKEEVSPQQSQSPDDNATYTTDLNIVDPTHNKRWPMFSVLNRFGQLLPGENMFTVRHHQGWATPTEYRP